MVCDNKSDELRRNALLLYPFIKNETISHGRAAEILGISKWELIELYGSEGFPISTRAGMKLNRMQLTSWNSLNHTGVK